ncbi:hypothetical protein [Rhizobium sp. Rhizsp42]|uniref:hypothetical protein n=1 Tax=Rhizobium sp. Rhizsp42 TaxID=3243034 RepID=UPI0039B0B3B3
MEQLSDLTEDLAKLPLSERRRRIFLKCVTKYRELGTPIDGDARFLELIEKWIEGDIEMREVATLLRVPKGVDPAPLPGGLSSGEERRTAGSPVSVDAPDTPLELINAPPNPLSSVIDELELEVSWEIRSSSD